MPLHYVTLIFFFSFLLFFCCCCSLSPAFFIQYFLSDSFNLFLFSKPSYSCFFSIIQYCSAKTDSGQMSVFFKITFLNDIEFTELYDLKIITKLKKVSINWAKCKVRFCYSFYWCIVDLQCCVIFRCTRKWVSYSYMYFHYLFFFLFSSHIGHYRVLSRVPCAIQQVLISYLFYI